MKNRKQVEETFENATWWAYKEGVSDGYNEAYNSLRNQAAIAAMQATLTNQHLMAAIAKNADVNKIESSEHLVDFAASVARELVKRLREEDNV